MQKFAETIAFPKSNGSLAVMAGATATIYNAGTAVLATLYQDDEVTTKTNPLTSDADGLVQCRLANGKYDISYSNGGTPVVLTGYVAYDPPAGGYDPTAVAITGGTINGVVIGGTTPADGTFAKLRYTNDLDFKS